MRSVAPLAPVVAPLLAVLVSALGCASKDKAAATVDAGTDAAPVELTKFSPKGCGYTVSRTQVDGLGAFEPHADVASAAPALKNVRRGLGGEVAHGAPSFADPSKSFSVGWQTDIETLASRVRFGASPDALDQTAEGFSYVVPRQLSIGPADGLRFHEVHVCGLAPGRTYYYQVGGGAEGKEVYSPVFSLTTAPASSESVKIGFSGDSRDALGRTELPVWRSIARRYKADGTQLVLFSGDMVLASAAQDQWDTWYRALGDSAPTTFYALAPGNHENEQARAFAHLLMPGAATVNAERYSSFDYGPVHVVMLDDYPGVVSPGIDDSGYKAELSAWLDQDLAAAVKNRANVPWIVTFHHHPVYSDTTQASRDKEKAATRAFLQPLYDKHQVDLDLAGHDHFYERFKTMLAGDKEDPKGTAYVVNGASGAPAYSLKDATPLAAYKTQYDPEKGEGVYGIATVDKATFKVKMYRVSPAGSSPADDAVLDQFELAKK